MKVCKNSFLILGKSVDKTRVITEPEKLISAQSNGAFFLSPGQKQFPTPWKTWYFSLWRLKQFMKYFLRSWSECDIAWFFPRFSALCQHRIQRLLSKNLWQTDVNWHWQSYQMHFKIKMKSFEVHTLHNSLIWWESWPNCKYFFHFEAIFQHFSKYFTQYFG